MTSLRFKTTLIICACSVFAIQGMSQAAADDNKAHSLAERFAGAHDTDADAGEASAQTTVTPDVSKPTTPAPKTAAKKVSPLTTQDVENAFEQRKQAEALKRHDELISSIEDRTKAIEQLLEDTDAQSWKSDVTVETTTPLTNRTANSVTESKPAESTPAPETVLRTDANPLDASTTILQPSDTMAEGDGGELTTTVLEPAAPPLAAVLEPSPAAEDGKTSTDANRRDIEPPTYALGAPRDLGQGLAQAAEYSRRGTVLLLIEPGNKGIRRFKKTADPVLCSRFHCYRSQGPGRSAVRMSRGETLGPFNTLGLRAGSCRSQLACAFRDVELGKSATALQPVDLKLMKHDRRQQRAVTADDTCQILAGRIYCTKPIIAKTWKAWIVPESVAIEAGADAIQTALDEGLPDRPPEAIASQPLASAPVQ